MGRLGSAVHKQEKDLLIVFAPLPPTFADNCLYLAFLEQPPFQTVRTVFGTQEGFTLLSKKEDLS